MERIVNFDEHGGVAITGELVRCGKCKYWSGPVDEINGNLYGNCQRPVSAITPTSFVSSTWYCGDGEREVQDGNK